MNHHGTYPEPGTVRFERLLPGPIERVWSYLTDSDKRRTWLAAGDMDLRVGGSVELRFANSELTSHEEETPEDFKNEDGGDEHVMFGVVTACEAPRLLAFTWGEKGSSEVTFELSERQDKVLLLVSHRKVTNRDTLLGVSSGWHAHLGLLVDRLEGREPGPFWATFLQLEKEYDAKVK